MSPASSAQNEAAGLLVYDECRAVKMSARKSAANFQFLADDDVVAFPGNLQPIYSARRSASEGLQVANRTKVHGEPRSDQIGKLFGGIRDPPAIEIASLLIESRENA